MNRGQYIDVNKFNEYLEDNVSGILHIVSRRKSENVYIEQNLGRSFEFVECDFLENQSITLGYFKKNMQIGYWEEFRLRFNVPAHFQEKKFIPQGKYRVRVEKIGGNDSFVRTFIRKFGIWKEKALPEGLPLEQILNGNIEDYKINLLSRSLVL